MAERLLGDGEMEACEQAFGLAFGCVPSMVAKAACELGIPEILGAHDEPLSAQQIVHRLPHVVTRPVHEAAEQLERIMRFLSTLGFFKAYADGVSADDTDAHGLVDARSAQPVKYGPTPLSGWFRGGSSLQQLLLFEMSSTMLAPWQHLSQCILQESPPFHAAHSMDVWALAASQPPFRRFIDTAMASASQISLLALLGRYQGFHGVSTLVDVGGGIGIIASGIVTRYPSMKAINFDLPHVVATAPIYPGVEHIAGDMFESIPKGDAIFMKWMLHDWDDEDCIKILKNCHKALPKHGKVIIMEAVLDVTSSTKPPFNNVRMACDMVMMAHTTGGKERSRQEWANILSAARFEMNEVIEIPCPQCIIEAFPLYDKAS